MFSKSRLYQPATPRTAPLTAAMRAALATIRTGRAAFAYNGISRPTVEALAAAGEIVLVVGYTWGTTEARKPFSQGDWSAYPAPLPSPAADAIRIIRWRELTSLHLGCDCEPTEPTEGSEVHRAYRAEQLAEAVAEAQSLATVNYPVNVCAKATAGHTPAAVEQRSAAAIAAERPATPSEALARALKRLGLTQGRGEDFRVTGFYRNGERRHTYALVLSRRAEELIAEHADRIEAELAAGPYPFRVSVRHINGRPIPSVSNSAGERVRETAPTTPTTPAPAVEDVLDGIAAACLTLQMGGRLAEQSDAEQPEQPGEPVLLDRNGATLTTNALVTLHGPGARPGGIVSGWHRITGAVLVGVRGGMVVHVGDSAEIELVDPEALAEEHVEQAAPVEAAPYRQGLGAELIALLVTVLRGIDDLPAGAAGHRVIAETLRAEMRAARPVEEQEALRAGFGAAGGWHRHIATVGGEASELVRSHVNALGYQAFAVLLGRMVEAGVRDNYQAADFFAELDTELRERITDCRRDIDAVLADPGLVRAREAAEEAGAAQQPATRGAELVALLLDVFPEDVATGAAQHQLMAEVVIDMFHASRPDQPEKEALRAGFRAVAGWSKHIAGGRASVPVCAHVNALPGRGFAELLGRMADAGVTNNGQAGDFFTDLGRELRAAADQR
ncbi:hypothetical protein ACFWA9_29170 [Kitasatospora sp. NPDC059973]|uniref:hypothetical protein n=1 Tax=Kitasatospora sp. NPDC059973 TaxID=3347020 RepID=UPI0036C816C9